MARILKIVKKVYQFCPIDKNTICSKISCFVLFGLSFIRRNTHEQEVFDYWTGMRSMCGANPPLFRSRNCRFYSRRNRSRHRGWDTRPRVAIIESAGGSNLKTSDTTHTPPPDDSVGVFFSLTKKKNTPQL